MSFTQRTAAPVIAAVLLAAPVATAEWHHYVVDSINECLLPRVRVRGRAPHVLYYSGGGLEYAVRDSTGWTRQTVAPAATFHNGNPALAFDREGNPHVAWFRGTPWYARWDGAQWRCEEIDPDSSGDHISLAFDADGAPAVAYAKRRGLFNSMLKFARRDSLGWHPELVDSSGGTDCALARDTAGRFVIAHCESWSEGALYYTRQADSGWVSETVVAQGASQSRLALDDNGDPHISYYWVSGGAYDLRYADRAGGNWRTDIVDAGQQPNKRGWDNWIVRDRSGTYHISYHAHNELELRYARGTFGSWQTEVVNTVGMWNLGSSIDLDEFDRPVIAYVNEDQAFRLYVSSAFDLTGVREATKDEVRKANTPSVVRGVLYLEGGGMRDEGGAGLLDIAGREVMRLRPGANDVSGVSPGVYFVRRSCGCGRVVIAR